MGPFLQEPLLNCNNDPALHHIHSRNIQTRRRILNAFTFTDPENIVFLKKRLIFERFVNDIEENRDVRGTFRRGAPIP